MVMFRTKRPTPPLSAPISPEQTEAIVASLLSLYRNNGMQMSFMFVDSLISLKEFYATILQTLAELNWPFEKEEIAQVWHFLYVLRTEVTKVGAEFGMHRGMQVGKSEEVTLYPSFMADVLSKKEGRKVPVTTANVQFGADGRIHHGPTHELRITSFKSIWFYGAEPYLKRIRVLRDAKIVTCFITEKEVKPRNVRFSVTWLPHAHLNAFEVHNKHTGFQGGCHTTMTKQVLKSKPTTTAHATDFKALVWNITNTLPSMLTKTLYFLVEREQPSLILLPGAPLGGNFCHVSNALGYNTMTTERGCDGWVAGATILWNKEEIYLKTLPTYDKMIHICVQLYCSIYCYQTSHFTLQHFHNNNIIIPKLHACVLQCNAASRKTKHLSQLRGCILGNNTTPAIV